jgi:hypothetical protein
MNFQIMFSYGLQVYGSVMSRAQRGSQWKQFPVISSGKTTNAGRDKITSCKAANNVYPAQGT